MGGPDRTFGTSFEMSAIRVVAGIKSGHFTTTWNGSEKASVVYPAWIYFTLTVSSPSYIVLTETVPSAGSMKSQPSAKGVPSADTFTKVKVISAHTVPAVVRGFAK